MPANIEHLRYNLSNADNPGDIYMTQWRIVFGEIGNQQGHIVEIDVETDCQAYRQLSHALSPYRGDGWGYVERNDDANRPEYYPTGWYRL